MSTQNVQKSQESLHISPKGEPCNFAKWKIHMPHIKEWDWILNMFCF